MLGAITGGVQLALRSSMAPFVLGMRWVRRRTQRPCRGIPLPRKSLAVSLKIALDECFFASELISATIVPRRDHPRVAAEIEEAISLFEARGWLENPARYHRPPRSWWMI